MPRILIDPGSPLRLIPHWIHVPRSDSYPIGQCYKEEAIQFALEIGPAGEIIRLAEEEGERLKGEVILALEDVIGKFEKEDGSVWAPSSAWFVTAYNPKE